jgi:hypothetical protein
MLVVVGIFALVIVGSSQILIMVIKHNRKAEAMLTIHEIGDNIISRMNRKIMPAAGLATGQVCGVGMTTVDLLRIDRAGLDFGCEVASPPPPATPTDNGRIYYTDDGITTEFINNDGVVVQGCGFSCYDDYVIDFTFTLENGGEVEAFLTSIAMRNARNR